MSRNVDEPLLRSLNGFDKYRTFRARELHIFQLGRWCLGITRRPPWGFAQLDGGSRWGRGALTSPMQSIANDTGNKSGSP